MIGPCCHHDDLFAKERLGEDWLVLIFSSAETQLSLGAVTADVDVAFVCEDEGVLASQCDLLNSCLLF